jgi:hypothetical protein
MSTIVSSELLDKLLSVVSADELRMIADSLSRAKERAFDRRSVQVVEIHFDEKGRARRVGASDFVWFPAPGRYGPPE